jgi:hypothetical protein
MKTSTMNGQGQCALGKVYFIVSMLSGVSLGYDMRGDFPAHTRGTRNLETAKQWKSRLESEHSDLRGELHIMATPSFVLDERAPLEVVAA